MNRERSEVHLISCSYYLTVSWSKSRFTSIDNDGSPLDQSSPDSSKLTNTATCILACLSFIDLFVPNVQMKCFKTNFILVYQRADSQASTMMKVYSTNLHPTVQNWPIQLARLSFTSLFVSNVRQKCFKTTFILLYQRTGSQASTIMMKVYSINLNPTPQN